jgi:hypothetical protein
VKVSEFLRQYQITGLVPETPPDDAMVAFWAGWLMGGKGQLLQFSSETRLETACKAAEFIEDHAKG